MDNFTIISRDCHGFQYYNKEYNTPTIGNCMIIQDFIKFVKNINIINNITLKFDENYPCISKDCNYPIGLLTISENINIYIHFMHDNNKIDILNKYNRRLNRMIKTTKKNYIFFLNDLDLSKSFDLNYPRYFDITIDELLGGYCKTNKIQQAKQLIKGLYGENVLISSADMEQKAEAIGISKRTMDMAKKELNIKSKKQGSSWYWDLDQS